MTVLLETLISIEQYLATDYDPDVDYVDGRLEERNLGEKSHGKFQLRVAMLLYHMDRVFPFIETRLQISESLFRVPDVCVYLDEEPEGEVLRTAPFVCIEILSPEDRMKRMLAVAQDYVGVGVEHVWFLDPWESLAFVVTQGGGLEPVSRLEAGPISWAVEELFRGL